MCVDRIRKLQFVNMSISYEEALATLESMFGHSWSREQLDAVLRDKQGHMENTVDLILRHGEADPQVLVDQLKAGIDPEENAQSMDEQLARQLAQGQQQQSASATNGVGKKKGRGTPVTLPDDFLRLPNQSTSSASASVMDDEALARMLQDELFSQELARNPDFAHLARGRPVRSSASSNRISDSRRPSGQRPAGPVFGAQSPDIMKKLTDMGDTARRRLQLMAAQFNARASGQGGLTGSAGGNTNGASPSAAERRGLLDDADDTGFASRKDL